jgi:hypothetical protein
MQIRFKLNALLYLIAICAVAFCLLFRLDRNTADLVGGIAYFVFGFMAPYVLLWFCVFRLIFARRLTRPLITCPLLSVALFGWPAVFASAFLTEPQRPVLLIFPLFIGVTLGIYGGFYSRPFIKDLRATEQGYPDNNPVRLNACLFALVLGFLVAWQGLTWLVWDVGQSVGIAVKSDDAGWLSFDFYGNSVNHRTVGIALGPRVAPGCVERFKLFGLNFTRGFLPFDEDTGIGVHLVRRIAFHRTQVGDWIIPVLTQFSELTSLDLRGTRITGAGVREIQMALPRCEIVR